MIVSFNNITAGKEDDIQDANRESYPAGTRYYVIAREDFIK